MNPTRAAAHPRLEALDALRGATMVWLLGAGPLLLHLVSRFAPGFADQARLHTSHAPFGSPPQGLHDLVMPLFLFMSGTAMAVSGPWSTETPGRPEPGRIVKLLRRTAILWLLGMVVQGNLLSYAPASFIPYSNTLQAIAAGGLIAEILGWIPDRRLRLAAIAALPCAYLILTRLYGDGYEHAANAAIRLDDTLQGADRGDRDYAWTLPSLNFAFTVGLGILAGKHLRAPGGVLKKSASLAGGGILAWCAAHILSPVEPINKHLWTGTFCLWAGGWSCLALAASHAIFDGLRIHATLLKAVGTNALLAYMIAEVFPLTPFADTLIGNLENKMAPESFAVIHTAVALALAWGILAILHRHRVFLKI